MDEQKAVDVLNQILERLESYTNTENAPNGEMELQDIPSKINDIIKHSSPGHTKTFIRTPQMDHDIFHSIILFYSQFKDKHANDIQTIKRAKRWVGDSIMHLIGNNHDLHIPSLDALLTSIGEYNTLEFNEMKSDFLLGIIRDFSSHDEVVHGNDAYQEMLKLRRLLREEPRSKEVNDVDQTFLSQEMQRFLGNDQSLLELID
jgi:hypothetical protein